MTVAASFGKALAGCAGVSIVLGALGGLQAGVLDGSLATAWRLGASTTLWLFTLGLPFACLVAALICTRAATHADIRSELLGGGVLVTMLAFVLWTFAVPLTRDLWFLHLSVTGTGSVEAARDVADHHAVPALILLPLLLTVLGAALARSPIRALKQSHRLKATVAAFVGVLVGGAFAMRGHLATSLHPILAGWLPALAALMAIAGVSGGRVWRLAHDGSR